MFRRTESRSKPRLLALMFILLGLIVVGLAPVAADAASATYRLQGTVTIVTDGTGGTIDLTGQFSLGQPFSMYCTIDLSTIPVSSDPDEASYTSCVTGLSFDVGGYSGSMSAANNNGATVKNNVPLGEHCGLPGGSPIDEYVVTVIGIDAPAVGGQPAYAASFGLTDCQGAALDNTGLPSTLSPDFDLDRCYGAINFFDGQHLGTVTVKLNGAVPTLRSSWGSLKSHYR